MNNSFKKCIWKCFPQNISHLFMAWCGWRLGIYFPGTGHLQYVGGPFNTMRPRRNVQHFADDTFKCIFFNENVWISIKISLTFVPHGPFYNIPALVQIMAWRRPGDKPLYEAMMDSLSTHICVTRPQWVDLFSHLFEFQEPCAACWAHLVCDHELWPSSMSRPCSSSQWFFRPYSRKHYNKLLLLSVDLSSKILLFHVAFLLFCAIFIIKSPQYTGVDFMFLYRFVCHRRLRAADLMSTR